jgi:hypothetical protein
VLNLCCGWVCWGALFFFLCSNWILIGLFTTNVFVPHSTTPYIYHPSSFETSGRHQLSADRLSALASLAGVHSVSPSVNLVNDGIYTVVLSYQDTAQHIASRITHANVTFDTVTTPPVLSAPATVRNDALHRVS